MKKINILYIPVSGEIKLMEAEDSSRFKENVIGGNPEYLRFTPDDNMLMVVNEGAKLRKEGLNIRASCIANTWSRQNVSWSSSKTIYGDVFIEGCQLGMNSKTIESCSLPIKELEPLIDYCNKAESWWDFAQKNIVNSTIFQWFTAATQYFDDGQFKF